MFPIHSHHVLTLQVLAIIWLNCSFHRFSHLTIFKDYAKTRLFHKFITSTWMIHCRQMKFRGLCLVLSCFTIWTIYPLILSFIFFIFISLYFMCGRAWYCWVLIWCIPAIFMCRQFELWTPVSLRCDTGRSDPTPRTRVRPLFDQRKGSLSRSDLSSKITSWENTLNKWQ